MATISTRLLHLVLFIFVLGANSPNTAGVNALPFTTQDEVAGEARSLRVSRPRIGIVVKGNGTRPQFGGSAFSLRGLRAESSGSEAEVNDEPGLFADVEHLYRRGSFDSHPGAQVISLPLTKVGGVRLKTDRDFHPSAELRRHLHAANVKLATMRRRAYSLDSANLGQQSASVPALVSPLLPSVTSVGVPGPAQSVAAASPPHPQIPAWHGDPRILGHGPALMSPSAHKRLLGGLIGALGGDSSGSASGFGGPANTTSDPVGGLLDGVGDITPNIRTSSASRLHGSGYPVKNLQAATTASITEPERVTAEQSLGLAIEANDVGYIATIQVGSNQQPFRMLIDSGSADTWVPSSTCSVCGSLHTKLGPDTSKTFRSTSNKFTITYGTGSVSGFLGHDNVYVAGLKLANHTLGVAQQQSRDFTDPGVPFDGLMGLARSELSNAGVPTPIDALFASGQVSAPVMGYRLGRVADGHNDGEVTFGGVDRLRFKGNLIEVDNVSKQGFWEAAMDAVSFNGKDLGLKGRTAILDTGTTLIVAPRRDADAVHAAIPGSRSDGQGGYYIPCTTNQSLALTFGGVSFSIDPRDMLFLPVDQNNLQGDCISAISSGQVGQQNEWLVGAVWLKNLYFATNSRTNTIGLGKLKD
ncbi:hypothetical protein OC846_004578 [Tilletia horrida]|uniref:Peptidase A1 domain-containing protein n=1 Tax=Tilletia horrida TaxID=155126 RepID=A0AAN6JSN3_9BASI|nr:hypothetical protein OC846_004578 [Tilletia horrida]KAK0568957.1 hypothetical protein OC861_001394 [Tilletia horrida]